MKKAPEAEWPVEIIRSKNRKKTVSAELKNGVLLVRAPARMSKKELAPIIEKLQKRLHKKVHRSPQSDAALEELAHQLNQTYFLGILQW